LECSRADYIRKWCRRPIKERSIRCCNYHQSSEELELGLSAFGGLSKRRKNHHCVLEACRLQDCHAACGMSSRRVSTLNVAFLHRILFPWGSWRRTVAGVCSCTDVSDRYRRHKPSSPVSRRRPPHTTTRKFLPPHTSKTLFSQDMERGIVVSVLLLLHIRYKNDFFHKIATSALLAQSVERETLSPHDLNIAITQYISRLWVRPPRRACLLLRIVLSSFLFCVSLRHM
jgi:hypothetical protein